MANVFDYFPWRGDLTMAQSEFCDVDRLLLCELVYTDIDAIEPRPLDEICTELSLQVKTMTASEKKKFLHLKQDERLYEELSVSPRFRSCRIGNCISSFIPELEQQFAAMTVELPDGTVAVVYRGTDWSLIGWKEDINMAYCDILPSQERAVDYLRSVGSQYQCPLRIMGHSKGGNLAIFAGSFCGEEIASRILEITSLDAPGFGESVLQSDGYKRIADRVRTILPRSSIVGALFTNTGKFSIVESSSTPLMQHITYNWEIMGNHFLTVAERDGMSQLVGSAVNEWIGRLEPEKRKKFIDTVWSLLASTDIEELGDLLDGKNAVTMIKNYNALDEESRNLIGEILAMLKECTKESFHDLLAQWKK